MTQSSPDANTQASPSPSQLFTVRVWAEVGEGGQATWRFKVQHVLSGEARYFHDWQALVEFMVGRYSQVVDRDHE